MSFPLKMETKTVKAEKDDQKKDDSLQCNNKDMELADDSSVSKRMVEELERKDVLVLNVKQSQSGGSCIQESFFQYIHSKDGRIPKYIVSPDEKHLRHCLKLKYVSAAKAASCNIPKSLSSVQTGNLPDSLGSLKIRSRYACDLNNFVIECPVEAGAGNVCISPAGEWIVGTITRSKSTMDTLESPLFRQSSAVESFINFGRTNLIDATKSISSPGGLSISSSQNLEKKMVVLENDRYGSKAVHKRLVSVSSTNSTFSDQSSSSIIPAGINQEMLSCPWKAGFPHYQGMLHCTWKAGFPHYVFTLDYQKEIYVANLFKSESPDDKLFDYMYMFHSTAGGRKEHEVHRNESDLVGKMRVSTKFTLCPNNSEIKETEFVLFGADTSSAGEIQTSSRVLTKNKGLSKKMVKAFKASRSSRERTSSIYEGISTLEENGSGKPCPDSCTNPSPLGAANFSVNELPPNLELASIIVKDHICGSRSEAEIGGWGLKFLKKIETQQAVTSVEASPSECCLRNTSDCSTSVDILVPAGFHGGPRNRIGGPSSLTERWRSGGHCDCGGWDIGCPLTVLNTRPSKKEPQADVQEDCSSFDLFKQGSAQAPPIMKMVNVHDGLYIINFHSTLSALQSLSIAVAIIHTRSPALQPKVYRN